MCSRVNRIGEQLALLALTPKWERTRTVEVMHGRARLCYSHLR